MNNVRKGESISLVVNRLDARGSVLYWAGESENVNLVVGNLVAVWVVWRTKRGRHENPLEQRKQSRLLLTLLVLVLVGTRGIWQFFLWMYWLSFVIRRSR